MAVIARRGSDRRVRSPRSEFWTGDEEMMSLKVARCADYPGTAMQDARELFRDSDFANRVQEEVRLLPWRRRSHGMKVDRDRRLS